MSKNYQHAPENYLCPFCLLIQGIEYEHVHSVQSDIVFRDRSVTAFIGSHQWPRNLGNTIVVPNVHFENIFGMPDEYALPIHKVVKMLVFAMKEAYGCDGISTRQHNEPAGYQDVWHYHVHVTPRYYNDRFYPTYETWEIMPIAERAEHARRLKESLAHLQ